METRQLTLTRPLHLMQTVAPVRVHRRDPTMRLSRDELVRASRTPDGPATIACKLFSDGRVEAGAWGPGASYALDALPALLGEDDDLTGFEPELHPTVAKAHHRHPGLRINRTGDVEDILVPTILGQRVTGEEAVDAWRRLVLRHGEPAPGPHDGLLVRPEAAFYASLPDHVYRQVGVEASRTKTVREACRRVGRLAEAATMATADAEARLRAVPGLGVWTASIIQRIAFGDPDTIELGDFHIPNSVAYALAGEERGTDERMTELLEPWRGQRGRVVRLLGLGAPSAPKHGPRGQIVNSATLSRPPQRS